MNIYSAKVALFERHCHCIDTKHISIIIV